MGITRLEEALRILRSPGRGWLDKADRFREVPELVQGMDPEFDYRETYESVMLNLLYLRRGLGIDSGAARHVVAKCVRTQVIQEAEFYWRVASLAHHGDGEPWLSPGLALPAGECGVVVYTLKFGMVHHIALDLVLSGRSVCQVVGSELARHLSWTASALRKCRRHDRQNMLVVNGDSPGAVTSAYRALNSGAVLVVVGDGRPRRRRGAGRHNVTVDFLGRKIAVDSGFLHIGRKARADICGVMAVRREVGGGELCQGRTMDSAVAGADGVQELYDFFEPFVRARSEQWEGVSGIHRLVARRQEEAKEGEREESRVRGLAGGRSLRRSSQCCVMMTRDDGSYCVRVDAMKGFRVDSGFEELTRAVVEAEAGRDLMGLLTAVKGEERARRLRWLSKLAGRGLIEDAA